MRFHAAASPDSSLTSWNVVASQGGRELKRFEGTTPPKPSLDWVMADDQKSMPKLPGVIDYRMTAVGTHGDSSVAAGTLPIEQTTLHTKKVQRVAEREVERFNLVRFDFQSAQIAGANARLVEMIKEKIKPNSVVTITGHTDRTGDSTINMQLSLERARNTAKALGTPNATIRGLGSESLPYDNNYPEGRVLSRTVEIVIETPAESM